MSTKRLLFVAGVLVCNTLAIVILAAMALGCAPVSNPDTHPCVLKAERVCRVGHYCSESCEECVRVVVTECMKEAL